jgi:beta-lactamase regulating signal transducer with metallopeptidase domain
MYFAAIDVSRRERAWWDTSLSLMLLLMQPALLLGIFRLVYWQEAGQSAPLAIWLMVLLDAGAALCFSGVVDGVWLGVAVMLAVLSVWNIVRIVRTFGVDGKPK